MLLLPSATSLSCCWVSSPFSPVLLLETQHQCSPPCISCRDMINLILLSIVSVMNALVHGKLLKRRGTAGCLWIVWIPNRNCREEKKKIADVQADQLLSLDSRMTFEVQPPRADHLKQLSSWTATWGRCTCPFDLKNFQLLNCSSCWVDFRETATNLWKILTGSGQAQQRTYLPRKRFCNQQEPM